MIRERERETYRGTVRVTDRETLFVFSQARMVP